MASHLFSPCFKPGRVQALKLSLQHVLQMLLRVQPSVRPLSPSDSDRGQQSPQFPQCSQWNSSAAEGGTPALAAEHEKLTVSSLPFVPFVPPQQDSKTEEIQPESESERGGVRGGGFSSFRGGGGVEGCHRANSHTEERDWIQTIDLVVVSLWFSSMYMNQTLSKKKVCIHDDIHRAKRRRLKPRFILPHLLPIAR